MAIHGVGGTEGVGIGQRICKAVLLYDRICWTCILLLAPSAFANQIWNWV